MLTTTPLRFQRPKLLVLTIFFSNTIFLYLRGPFPDEFSQDAETILIQMQEVYLKSTFDEVLCTFFPFRNMLQSNPAKTSSEPQNCLYLTWFLYKWGNLNTFNFIFLVFNSFRTNKTVHGQLLNQCMYCCLTSMHAMMKQLSIKQGLTVYPQSNIIDYT